MQLIGYIAKEFGYKIGDIVEMPVEDLLFLAAWLSWYSKTIRRRRR